MQPAILTLCLLIGLAMPLRAQRAVQFDLEQPRLAIAYLAAETSVARDSLWRLHRATRAYQRLHEREASMNRAFSDSSFRAFLDSDSLKARTPSLVRALASWASANYADAEQRARRYLPASAPIRATVYVMIKPRTNSFVFDVTSDPAVFLYLDPAVSAAKFTNTAAHELHHIGLGASCAANDDLTSPTGIARRWLSAFGEGWAMLAAVGSPTVHPHVASDSAERSVWDAARNQAPSDLKRLERYFGGILDGSIGADSAATAGFSFFNERSQGPWYTVGWLMVSAIERRDGREALVRLACDPAAVIRRYHELTRGTAQPQWSDRFVRSLDILTDSTRPARVRR